MLQYFIPLLLLAGLAACSGNDAETITGDRVAVLKPQQSLQADPELKTADLDLPAPVENQSWPQVMGTVDGNIGNLAVSRAPQRLWSSSIGTGGGSDAHLLSRPVVADGHVYTIDTRAEVRAFAIDDGTRLWSRDLTPDEFDERQFGGGIAFADGTLFVTTGYGSVAALEAKTGKVLWRREVKSILRSAPAVAGGRIFITTDEGQTLALSASDGAQLWTHRGIVEPSTLLGTGVPIVADEVAYIPYGSGELYAVRVQNGRTLWQQNLSGNRRLGGTLEGISDIKGSPALDTRRVFAVSNSGRMIAVDRRTGNLAWDIDLGGTDTPVVLGEALAVLEDQNTLVLAKRDSGRVRATYPLPRYEDEENSKHPIYWTGPVLGDGILWVASNRGELRGIDAKTGETAFKGDLPGDAYLPPVLAQKTIFVLTDDGRLTAFR